MYLYKLNLKNFKCLDLTVSRLVVRTDDTVCIDMHTRSVKDGGRMINSNAIRHKVQTEGGDIQLKSRLGALTLHPTTSQQLITKTETLRPHKDMTQKRSDHVTLKLKSGRIVRVSLPRGWIQEIKRM